MRRSVKVAALASAAALLAIGASMTSFAAAKGWTQEDGEWVWLDSNGDKATGTFKLSGTTYYWLNDDGYLGSDEIVEYEDNYYYVDETGAMVRNQWREVENTEDDEQFEDTIWYYFQSSGKAYKSGKKSINGQSYIFDEDGKMLFGWIKKDDTVYSMADNTDSESDDWKTSQYYAGDANDGAVVTSAWRQIRVYDGSPDEEMTSVDAGDNDYWFYFGSNGKKYAAEDNDDYVTKTIKGSKYAFACDGHMLSEWTPVATSATNAQYFSDPEVGARITKGWFKVVPSKGVDEQASEENDNDEYWFYADGSGNLITSQIKSLNGKKYLFNDKGECLAGLRYLTFEFDENGKEVVTDKYDTNFASDSKTSDDLDEVTIEKMDSAFENYAAKSKEGLYYFATPVDTDAAMKTGSCTITIDGDSYSFKFATSGSNKGVGITKVDGSSYYVNGRKLKADSEQKFVMYEIDEFTATDFNHKTMKLVGPEQTAAKLIRNSETTQANAYAVISSAGTIVKSGTKKDGDDYKLKVTNYVLEYIKQGDASSDDKNVWECKVEGYATYFKK